MINNKLTKKGTGNTNPATGYLPVKDVDAYYQTDGSTCCVSFDYNVACLKPGKWIDLYYDFLFNYTTVRVNDDEDVKDLVQETFVSALKAMDNFEYRCSERTWLISILKRKIVDYYRKKNSLKGKAELRMINNNEEISADWLENYFPDFNFYSDPETKMENDELGEIISKCIERLPEKYRVIFKMKALDGMKTEVICNVFDITPQNLWTIMHRARLQLMYSLEKSEYAPRK